MIILISILVALVPLVAVEVSVKLGTLGTFPTIKPSYPEFRLSEENISDCLVYHCFFAQDERREIEPALIRDSTR